MGAMAVIIEGIIVVIDEIPADQVVLITIGILVIAIGPTRILQQVAGIDPAIGVLVGHESAIGGVVQVAEGDQPVGINIFQLRLEADRYFALIEPNIQIKISMCIVDAGIDHTNNRLHIADIACRPGLTRLAAKGVFLRRGITQHVPQFAASIVRIVADSLDMDIVLALIHRQAGQVRTCLARGDVHEIIGLGEDHARLGGEQIHALLQILPLWQLHPQQRPRFTIASAHQLGLPAIHRLQRRTHLRRVYALAELQQNIVCNRRGHPDLSGKARLIG